MSKRAIAFLVFLVFNYLVLVFVVDYGNESNTDNYKVVVERLETENQDLKEDNLKLDQEIIEITQVSDSLSKLIQEENQSTLTLKRERDEEMDSINGMDDNELYRFFTNFKTDSITSR